MQRGVGGDQRPIVVLAVRGVARLGAQGGQRRDLGLRQRLPGGGGDVRRQAGQLPLPCMTGCSGRPVEMLCTKKGAIGNTRSLFAAPAVFDPTSVPSLK